MENEDEYITIECCMKNDIKTLVNLLLNKKLSDTEVTLLCIYHFLMNMTICCALIQFKVVDYCVVWFFSGFLTNHFVITLTLFLKTMLLVKLIENIKEIVFKLKCKCDCRQIESYAID